MSSRRLMGTPPQAGGAHYHTVARERCCAAKLIVELQRWVIFDRSSRFGPPVDVRFPPKATLDLTGDRLKTR